MTMITVQFSDSTQKTIVAYLGSQQDATLYPNQGLIDLSDSRWAAFFSALPSNLQRGLPQPAA